jgi:hypothetical protein
VRKSRVCSSSVLASTFVRFKISENQAISSRSLKSGYQFKISEVRLSVRPVRVQGFKA